MTAVPSPIPSLLPSTMNVKTIQADTVKMKTAMIGNTLMKNGYISTAGPESVVVTGQTQTYPVATVCAGMIVRTGTTSSTSADVLPSATAMATQLGLPSSEGISYIRTMTITNNAGYAIEITGTGWTIDNGSRNMGPYDSCTFSYVMSYTVEDGWEILCFKTGVYNLD